MTDNERDPNLLAAFAAPTDFASDADFTLQVMRQTDSLKRRRVYRRIAIGLVAAVLATPLQDFAIAFAQLFIVALIHIDNQLVAQLLAPINSVGGALSITLLGIRAAHKRLFG